MLKQARRGIRLLQVGDLVIKHGLGSLLDFLGVSPRVFRRLPLGETPERALPVAHRVRLLLQDLGPTFIKLGQILSTRSDMLGPDFIHELRKLQDEVEPFPYSEVEQVILTDLGKTIDELFAVFDPRPVAAASIGQVHRARTLDGRNVAVKVQRPGVTDIIRDDMGILSWAARRLETRMEMARKMNITGLLQEFEDLLMDELVYSIEGRNADRMRANLSSNHLIRIPEVIWPLTSRHVLTLEDVTGIKLSNREALTAAGLNLPELAVGMSQAYIKQILVDGFFHGDPHQGNFFVGEDGRIAIVDFGIMGRLDEKTRDSLVDMFIAVYSRDSEAAVEHLVSLGAVSPDTDMVALTREVERLLSKYYFLPRQEFRIGEVMSQVLGVVHRHDVLMPTDLALLAKVLLTIEGICLQLDPEFDFNTSVQPFATELMQKSVSPKQLYLDFIRNARDVSRAARVVPEQISDILGKVDRGRMRMIVQYDHSDRSLDHFYEIGNRLAMSIALASMMIGSGLILHTHVAPLLGYVGYVVSFVLLCRLLFVMLWGLPAHRRHPPRRPR